MIIYRVNKISTADVANYSWRRLAQFYNTDFTAKQISSIHCLDKKQNGNAKKQAEQIKYCLIQAKEYFDASSTVSLATKPLLLYYCTMSLALAEILMKQTADSRLSALRANHNCHGLAFTFTSNPLHTEALAETSSKMIAKAQINSDGMPKGTFEVWRRSAREYPLGGEFTQYHANGHTKGFRAILGPVDEPPPVLPKNGLSLLSCLKNLPYMADSLVRWGSRLEMIRATVQRESKPDPVQNACTIIVHPAAPDLLDLFASNCKMDVAYMSKMNIKELPSGFIVTWNPDTPHFASFPHSTCINDIDVYFTCSTENLGEFGYLYVAFHIMGNFARYYPDLWMKHIEVNSPLANAIDDLCNYATERLPLLSLSELSRSYHVIAK